MATRNRSGLFETALQSVLQQTFRNFEVVVVNDGSSEQDKKRYQELVDAAEGKAKILTLAPTENGHGQSYPLNFGARHARGGYLCFLDDDDQWIDAEHLTRTANVLDAAQDQVDLVLANQRAFRNGTPALEAVWIEDLKDRLQGPPDLTGAYTVSPRDLLASPAHCHLNTTIVSRAFYLAIGGLDEQVRYECDRDFYLRAIDHATVIKYLPFTVSRHNIPDPNARSNMSTTIPMLSKRLDQLRVFDKVILLSTQPELRYYARRQRAYTLKHIATETARMGRLDCASYYAREALMVKPTFGWLALTVSIEIRRLISLAPAIKTRRSRKRVGIA